ncbi:hypothetical protein FHR84_000168 [Actinopolyspora biskrensis]|uniref:Uncharacterized protein n=1 Tax=Actinopolyspora biskrensis TaxID=1470178 RepID=A0A852YNJ2_9ACTN|nr:hypothetical protein [Actinopolyspora biskrensis]NYH76854.1 hypothetical protein [Actinopolyspora biskrensis]
MNSLAVFVMVATGTMSSIVTALVAMSWVEQRWVGTVPFTPTRVGEKPATESSPSVAGTPTESAPSESSPPEPSGENTPGTGSWFPGPVVPSPRSPSPAGGAVNVTSASPARRSGERAWSPRAAVMSRSGRTAAGRAGSESTDVRGLALSGVCVAVVLVCVLTQRGVRSPMRGR